MIFMRTATTKQPTYPLITGDERRRVWEKARGMWKDKRPDPDQELKKLRKEWNRKLVR